MRVVRWIGLVLFFMISSSSFAQDGICKKINVTTHFTSGGFDSHGNRQSGSYRMFSVRDYDEKKFGTFYVNLKPYIFCDDNLLAQKYFLATERDCKLKMGCFGIFCINSFFVTTPTGGVRYPTLFIGSGAALGTLVFYCMQRSHIKKCIKEHNLKYE